MAGESKAKLQRDAERFVLQGKLSQAISEYLKIIKIDPEDILTLNTIGDLYLRLGKPKDASTYFSQVADHYARNNFVLKAIAVYKKILSCDAQNLDIHKTLASLYTKQGLNVEARNQFLHIAEICSREGKSGEAQLAYEKVADLDPSNAAAQMKLAEIHLREGNKEKAYFYLTAAAKAQNKAGDHAAALESYERALDLHPGDIRTMTGLLEVSMKLGKISRALEVFQKSLDRGHESVDLLEMLVKIHLTDNDVANATAMLRRLSELDRTRFAQYFDLQRKLLELQDVDAAATCLDPVMPTLIERRAAKQAIEGYLSILRAVPDHVQTLIRLAEACLAANDQGQYLDALDKACQSYRNGGHHREALEVLERILQVTPESEGHLQLHRELSETVYPGIPYIRPGGGGSAAREEAGTGIEIEPGAPEAGAAQVSNPTLVEVDLLLTYGMRDKALELLRSLKSQNPSDRDARIRLIGLYREMEQNSSAAEESLGLAQEYRKAGDEESAQKCIADAGRLDPAIVASRPELLSPAEPQDAMLGSAPVGPDALASDVAAGVEVDLSEDLSDIFFKAQEAGEAVHEVEAVASGEEDLIEQFVHPATPPRGSVPLEEQLQEVDFYIRLGFFDEARAKLGEIEKEHPNHPEARLREQQISSGSSASEEPIALSGSPDAVEFVPEEAGPGDAGLPDDFKLIEEPAEAPALVVPEIEEPEPRAAEPPSIPAEQPMPPVDFEPAPEPATTQPESRGSQGTGMFADLLDEVDSLTDQEIAREEYETHFSLGIAYREMSLTDDSIKEFQEAMKVLNPAKHPREVIQCCGMLSTCFLEKQMPRSAIRWCETGLATPHISPHEAMALRYDMGVAFATLGEPAKALDFFAAIHDADPGYRDVADKINELRGDIGRHGT